LVTNGCAVVFVSAAERVASGLVGEPGFWSAPLVATHTVLAVAATGSVSVSMIMPSAVKTVSDDEVAGMVFGAADILPMWAAL